MRKIEERRKSFEIQLLRTDNRGCLIDTKVFTMPNAHYPQLAQLSTQCVSYADMLKTNRTPAKPCKTVEPNLAPEI